MEDAPWHRVADAHGVEFGGSHWVRYLQQPRQDSLECAGAEVASITTTMIRSGTVT